MIKSRPTQRFRKIQSGFALLLLIGVMGLGSIYMMMRAFNNAAAFSTSRQHQNALVLEEAKAALLAYVSAQVPTETYPGKLPCPEDTTKIGTTNEGSTQTYCSLPAVGRFPWKTIGLAQAPLDLDGEQLWYAVSPGFNRTSGGSLILNSNTPAGLTVDGSPALAVALIISPGRALAAQTRSAVSSGAPPAASNYLEGENASLDIKFATHGAAGSITDVFNDQVAIVSHKDLFTIVETAVEKRLNDTFVSGTKPLKSIYASSGWGTSASAPIFPYPAPFSNPETSSYQGSSIKTQGLLPVTFSTTTATQYCNTAADGPRCDPTFVKWGSFQSLAKQSGTMTLYGGPAPTCSVSDSQLSCTIYTNNSGTLTTRLVATASNVAMTLKQLDADAPALSGFSSGGTATAIINADGSSQVTYTAQVSSSGSLTVGCTSPTAFLCYRRTFSIPIRIFSDHPIVNSSDSEYGWFTKNEWHKLTYYAIASGFAASGARSCTGSACLTVSNLSTSPNNNKRVVLILAGRAIASQTRPSATLSNYLESENVSPVDTTFITRKPSFEFNDRVVVVDTN